MSITQASNRRHPGCSSVACEHATAPRGSWCLENREATSKVQQPGGRWLGCARGRQNRNRHGGIAAANQIPLSCSRTRPLLIILSPAAPQSFLPPSLAPFLVFRATLHLPLSSPIAAAASTPEQTQQQRFASSYAATAADSSTRAQACPPAEKGHHASTTTRLAAADPAAAAAGPDVAVCSAPPRGRSPTNAARFGWFVGHLTLLFCTFRYGLSYVTFHSASRWAQLSYRTAFVSAAATYGIVVYKSLKARAKAGQRPAASAGGALGLLMDENVQYLLMALVWLYSRQIPLALLPFSVYSIFHVATYTRANLIPVISPAPASAAGQSPGKPAAKGSPLADTIGRFVKQYYDASMGLVAALEIALWFRVLLSAFTFSQGGLLLLVIYSAFFRSRFAQSSFVQGAVHTFGERVDTRIDHPSTPPVAKQVWTTVKGVIQQIADATDLRKAAAAQQGAKKPQ